MVINNVVSSGDMAGFLVGMLGGLKVLDVGLLEWLEVWGTYVWIS
jgi:hypothetical protein